MHLLSFVCSFVRSIIVHPTHSFRSTFGRNLRRVKPLRLDAFLEIPQMCITHSLETKKNLLIRIMIPKGCQPTTAGQPELFMCCISCWKSAQHIVSRPHFTHRKLPISRHLIHTPVIILVCVCGRRTSMQKTKLSLPATEAR